MVKRSDSPIETPPLFDLPLVEPERAAREAPVRRPPRGEAPEALPLFPDAAEETAAPPRLAIEPPRLAVEPPRPAPERSRPRAVPPPAESAPAALIAGAGVRAAAGLADLLVHVGVAVILIAGSRLLGVEGAPPWPPLAVCLALFSFLYFVVPLAFWGNTPGMAWRGLRARSRGGEPLSFAQATLRWLGALFSAALAGLPGWLAVGGRSLTDRLSGSVLRRER